MAQAASVIPAVIERLQALRAGVESNEHRLSVQEICGTIDGVVAVLRRHVQAQEMSVPETPAPPPAPPPSDVTNLPDPEDTDHPSYVPDHDDVEEGRY